MTETQGTLFDLAETDDREQAAGTHVLMPNMSYACGGSILTKTGGFLFLGLHNFGEIGCDECREIGYEAIMESQKRQQGIEP